MKLYYLLKGTFYMRSCGVLMHISSLASPCGVGTLGREAYKFVDFLKKAGQSYWQILPVGPTGFGDSPYQCYSAFAGNPLLIDLDMLAEEGLIPPDDKDMELLRKKESFADYGQLFSFKRLILAKAYGAFRDRSDTAQKADFNEFCRKNSWWLDDYALFMSLKYAFKQKMWTLWDDEYRLRDEKTLADYSEKQRKELSLEEVQQIDTALVKLDEVKAKIEQAQQAYEEARLAVAEKIKSMATN